MPTSVAIGEPGVKKPQPARHSESSPAAAIMQSD
jgi:hypothetical protein